MSICKVLTEYNLNITICTPSIDEENKYEIPNIKVISYNKYIDNEHHKPDIIHCWTPREKIRKLYDRIVNKHGKSCPYIIHLEDDEEEIFQSNMGFSVDSNLANNCSIPEDIIWPEKYQYFIESATGITTLTKNLVGKINRAKPVLEFWPGCDDMFLFKYSRQKINDVYDKYKINRNIINIVYNGNVHSANFKEVRSLYIAVALLNRSGFKTSLIRTGKDYVLLDENGIDNLRENSLELGIIDRSDLPLLLQGADILVQPGNINRWNMGRFPSKVPEFLASYRPVILPRVNIGEYIPNSAAIILETANASEIFYAVKSYIQNKAHYESHPIHAREFYEKNLDWKISSNNIYKFYCSLFNSFQ
jgi:glycosyltransferase involved in cell wall biosynthesis